MFVLAILGCGDGERVCREARIEPVTYASLQACQLAQADALQRATDLDFPELATRCRARGVSVAAADPRPRG